MGVEDFLSHEPAAPEVAAPDEVSNTPVLENETPSEQTTPPEDTPPSGMDKRDQAIWREEREKRKELQRQVDQMNTRWQDMMQRMQAPAQPQQTQPQVPEIPSYEEDPLGHLKAQNDLMAREVTQGRAYLQQQQMQAQQMAQFQQLRGSVDRMESEFAQNNPDYSQALDFLYQNVTKMSKAMGYPPEAEQRIVAQTALDLTVRALQQGINPAEAAYNAAKSIGWSPSGGDDTLPAPALTKNKAPTSLGGVAGKVSSDNNPTWDAISKMDASEFDAWWTKFERQQRGR